MLKKKTYHGGDIMQLASQRRPDQLLTSRRSASTRTGSSTPSIRSRSRASSCGRRRTARVEGGRESLTKVLAQFPQEFTSIKVSDPRPTVQTLLSITPFVLNLANTASAPLVRARLSAVRSGTDSARAGSDPASVPERDHRHRRRQAHPHAKRAARCCCRSEFAIFQLVPKLLSRRRSKTPSRLVHGAMPGSAKRFRRNGSQQSFGTKHLQVTSSNPAHTPENSPAARRCADRTKTAPAHPIATWAA